MKKLLVLILALAMIASLAACGAKEVTLVDVSTEQGVSLKLPSDMPVSENNKDLFINTDSGDNAVIKITEAGEGALSEVTQEDFEAASLGTVKEYVIKSYDNKKKINGNDAIVCELTQKTEKGESLVQIITIVNGGSNNAVVALTYPSDNTEGSLAKNQQAIIDSISVKAP